ncbi:MAG: PKD domain-containing protein [Bacteroidetes bacterium]|nr:PKD domain-containing protein [Bacteroidota bacterium]
MRKFTTYFALSFAIVASVAMIGPCSETLCSGNSESQGEQSAYASLFNQRLAALPKVAGGEKEGKDKRNQPDMFAEFDKLKRMNPLTGEVPADGLQNAYEYFVSKWGEPRINPESNSNYGLYWDERGPTGIGGRTRAIMWDPNSTNGFFAGGVGGGLWHTDDVTVGSPNWTQVSPLFSNVAATCINYDPTNPMVMYYGTGEGWFNVDALRGAGVWKSTNGGMNWSQLSSTTGNAFYYCQGILVTNSGVLYVATKGGLQRSTDGGVTFTKVLGSGVGATNDWMTDIDIAGNGDLFVGVNGSGIYKSAGTLGATQGTAGTWTRLTTNFGSGYGRVEVAASMSNSAYVYAVCEVGNANTDIFRTTNGGLTWAATTAQPVAGAYNFGDDITNGQAWYDLSLGVDPSDHQVVYVGGINQHRTTNGGSSWTLLTDAYGFGQYIHPDQHSVAFNATNPQKLVFGNDGGIWYSSNRGTTVSEHNNNFNVTQYYSCAIDPRAGRNRIIGGAQDNGSTMVDAPGISAGIELTGSDGGYVAINAIYPDTMFTTTQYATVRRSRNGGNTFQSITNPSLNENNTLFINPMEISVTNPNYLFQGSTVLWMHPSSATGSAAGWRQITSSLGTNVTAIGPGYNPSTVVYFAAGGRVYRIANCATANSSTVPATVNPTGLGSGYINCVMVNPNDNNHIVVTFSSYGVAHRVVECRNADQGANAVWKVLTGDLPDLPCNWAVIEPNNPNGLLVGTDLGIFRCSDITLPANAIRWTPENMGMGIPRVEQIRARYSDKMVFLSTHGRGFYSTNSYNLVPAAAFSALNVVACDGIVEFMDSTSNAPVQWAWDFGDGGTSTVQHPTHQYSASGTYTVSLTATNPNGSSTTNQSITVTVVSPPTAYAGVDTSGCPGDTVQLSGSGGVSYAWAPVGAVISPYAASTQVVVNQTRTLILTVTDANGCTDTDTVVVSANASPSVWAGQDQTITTMGGSVNLAASGGVTYLWSPSTGLSCTNCPNPVASPSVTTTYTCTGYSAAGCERSDNVTVFVTIVGVDPSRDGGFSIDAVAPQPMNDRGMIRFTTPEAGAVRLDLIDMTGKLVGSVFDGNANAGQTTLQWERGTLASGMYFLRMRAGDHVATMKVVLQ